jgi:hypothetical protein
VSKRFVRVLPITTELPGSRFRLERFEGESHCEIVDEVVLPEQVDNPNANHIRKTRDVLCLTLEHQRWLHEALGEMLAEAVE